MLPDSDNIGIPVAMSVRPNSKNLSVSQGKGHTLELAMISAIMESLEAYHAENANTYHLIGSYNELSRLYPVINPTEFSCGDFTISELTEYSFTWTEAFELNSNQQVYIPHGLISLNTTVLQPAYAFFSVSSNGLAAGNNVEEAMIHGLCEVIERDSICRWNMLSEEEQKNSQVCIDSIDSSFNQQLLKKIAAVNIYVEIWDITSKVGVPAFQCYIHDNDPLRHLGSFIGTGAHIHKDIALSRALLEAAQTRLTLVSGSRDDIFEKYYKRRSSYMPIEKTTAKKKYQDCYQPLIPNSLVEQLEFLQQQLNKLGFAKIYYVNHTRPDINIPVVHIFVPNMLFNSELI